MKSKLKISQQLIWQPKPEKKSEVGIPYEEGKILPNAPEEDIALPMLRPTYSKKQLRRIQRIKTNKRKNERRALMNATQYEEAYL